MNIREMKQEREALIKKIAAIDKFLEAYGEANNGLTPPQRELPFGRQRASPQGPKNMTLTIDVTGAIKAMPLGKGFTFNEVMSKMVAMGKSHKPSSVRGLFSSLGRQGKLMKIVREGRPGKLTICERVP